MSNASLKALVPLLLLASCATTQSVHYWCGPTAKSAVSIKDALRQNPLAADQNIRVINLGIAAEVSHHIVQVRTKEQPHIHADHDLTVFVYRGNGIMTVGNQSFALRAGDSLFVPRGVIHMFQNKAKTPAVAIAIFTPAFDGKDTVPANQTK